MMRSYLVLSLVYTVYLVVAIHDREIDVPSYNGYKVIRTLPKDQQAAEALVELQRSDKYDFWSEPSLVKSTDIMAPPARVEELKKWLQEQDIFYTVLISDLQELFDQQLIPAANYSLTRSTSHSMTWDRYHRYDTILEFMDYLAATYSTIATVETLGSSYEGRTMKVLKVSRGGGRNKPAIYIHGGIHAREWISPATVTFMMNKLLEDDIYYPTYINNLDWYFIPTINPDGYEYTHTHSRMWRKTRSNLNPSSGCKGADANRNWDFHWNGAGVSQDPCTDIYCGGKAFSEVETKIISDFILEHKDRIKLFLDFHAFSQLWLTPWGYSTEYPTDYDDLHLVAQKAVNALTTVSGTRYHIGTSSNVLYPASGGCDDWAKGVAGVKYSYTIELRDRGRYGFALPTSHIVPSGEETFAGVKAAAAEIIAQYS